MGSRRTGRLAFTLLGMAFTGCTLLVDSSGLSGGGEDGSTLPLEAGSGDAPSTVPQDAGGDDAAADGADAAVDAEPFPPSDPGEVVCGAPRCEVPAFCCVQDSGLSCQTTGQSCPGSTEIHCDEPADCPSAQHCCLGPDAFNAQVPSSVCADSCAASHVRVCRSSASCGGQACLPVSCAGRTLGTCGGAKPTVCN